MSMLPESTTTEPGERTIADYLKERQGTSITLQRIAESHVIYGCLVEVERDHLIIRTSRGIVEMVPFAAIGSISHVPIEEKKA